jgi:hypothetical protein
MPRGFGLPKDLLVRLGLALLTGESRSFRADAIYCVDLLEPPLKIYGAENIPVSGPCLVTTNHYARPGFRAWWLALAVSAAVPAEVHWLITSAWTYPDRLRRATITPVTRRLLKRLAQVYGFTNLPPMPPDSADVLRRAEAVRRVLKFVRQSESPLIGLAPEGGDFAPPGRLAEPPPGSGRFIFHLCELGLDISPIGIFEEGGRLCLRFGLRYQLEAMPGLTASARDCYIIQYVMQHIAELIPGYNLP